ncbi:haloacid dehalogenase type II [Kribbella turkmenica]|uniref:haloacid dehalogenase type II n=1 Tax=Kribbella turkmenica TaxID=2530375 RepID=UPI0014051A5E|nr:haloacid dehalogenase type II [Kribbella turkmenica]
MTSSTRPSVLAFDLYGTLVDPIAIAAELDRMLPGGDGRAIAGLWRQKQVEYSFRATVMDRYRDFRWATEQALRFAAAACDVSLSPEQHADLTALYDHLQPFEDAAPALRDLRAAGHRLVVFSNGSPDMIGNCLANSGLGKDLDSWVSIDPVRAFKPAAIVYHHLVETLDADVASVRLVSCNAFDIDGAHAAGLATAWVNRSGGPFDGLDEHPLTTVSSLTELRDVIDKESL